MTDVPKKDDVVQYPHWTGYGLQESIVVDIFTYKGKMYFNLADGTQLDEISFSEGATVKE